MSLSQDLKAALRQLARKSLANAAAAGTLALGICSSVALFSLVDAVLLRPLPYPRADDLVAVWDSRPEAGHPRSRVSGFSYLRWREQARGFEALALLGTTSGFSQDKQRLEDTAAYLVRNPLSLKKLVYLDGQQPSSTAPA